MWVHGTAIEGGKDQKGGLLFHLFLLAFGIATIKWTKFAVIKILPL